MKRVPLRQGNGLKSSVGLSGRIKLKSSSGIKSGAALKGISSKGIETIREDEKIYEFLWNHRLHFCEECGAYLGHEFRDEDGRIIDRYRYSHMLGKKRWPMFRWTVENFNLLCFNCHNKWESGDRTKMKIWGKNKKTMDKLIKKAKDYS